MKSFSIFFCDGLIVWRDYRSNIKNKTEKRKGNSTPEIKQNQKCSMIGNNKLSHIE
jgi:hypothetical protein